MLKIINETKEREEWKVGGLILRKDGSVYMIYKELYGYGLINLDSGKCLGVEGYPTVKDLIYPSVEDLQEFISKDGDKIVEGELIIK